MLTVKMGEEGAVAVNLAVKVLLDLLTICINFVVGYKVFIDVMELIFKREFPCLQAGDDSVSFRLSFGLQYIFLLFLPIYDQRTLQNRILSRGMVNDYATMEIRSAGRRMNIPSTD